MGQETLILADLHLGEDSPEITQRLLGLEPRLRQADAIYILGDLVETWIGDDADAPPCVQAAFAMLGRISKAGVPMFFQHGNRDFLIGKALADRIGMRLLPEQCVVEIYGRRTALLHGDQLCTDDLAYQKMRRKLRHPLVKLILRRLPLGIRRKLAAGLRERSRAETGRKTETIMDVNAQAVEKTMRALDANTLIHGHTHRPAIHPAPRGLRAVLGDWAHGAALLSLTRDGLRLERIDDAGRGEILAESPWPTPASS